MSVEVDKKKADSQAIEDSKLDIAFGNQIRSYVLQPYRLVKDTRTKVEVGDVDRVLDGDLEPFMKAYLQTRAQQATTKSRHRSTRCTRSSVSLVLLVFFPLLRCFD